MTGTRFSLEVRPRIPAHLNRLHDLSNDLLYSWQPQIVDLFIRLDSELWVNCGHNPKVFLRRISQRKLEAAAQDRVFMEDYNRAVSVYDTYISQASGSQVQKYLNKDDDLIAYFCAEFGLHESFPIYSGGLGILAGDHCKAASDLEVPFIAIGMMYRQGYFTQTIDDKGQQQATYTQMNFEDLPISPATNAAGQEVHVKVDIEGRDVELKVWEAKAGHIKLYLLDTDLPVNSEHDRRITYQLYGGDKKTRIQQEIVLGIGGVRAIRALGLKPNVWHINEGHAAFQILERTREYVASGMDFKTALEATAVATVFTTHTPVPAGHDIFDHAMLLDHFEDYIKELEIDKTAFLKLGAFPSNPEGFNQTALALRGSRFHNGVSRIHGGIASMMEAYVWPEISPAENPISYVTNGIHVPTFLAREWGRLFDKRIGSDWRMQLLNDKFWSKIDDIPDHVFWSTHQALKLDLFEYLRERQITQHKRNGCSDAQVQRLIRLLNPDDTDVLVIGFARRFATYKRATLLFSDPDRLNRILNNPKFPVVLVFAGKAHPKDEPGQEFIRLIHEQSRKPEFEGKIILQEGYDIALARKLVSGVDVWLNNPEYPLEASGTSGEKAGVNGVINLSVLDGWWGEGYNGENGWAINPHGPEFEKQFKDQQEGQDLLSLLENKVVPLYYDRDRKPNVDDHEGVRTRHTLSSNWVRMSKASMKTIIPQFNAERMMMDYVRMFYQSAKAQRAKFTHNDYETTRTVAQWKKHVAKCWPSVSIQRIDEQIPEAITAGETLSINIAADLKCLDAKDVVIECIAGTSSEMSGFNAHETHRFTAKEKRPDGQTIFTLDFNPSLAGQQYYKIRMYPYHEDLSHNLEMGYMQWL